jgi:hypothetical protein
MAGLVAAGGVEADELAGQLLGGAVGAALGALPVVSAEAVDVGAVLLAAEVLLDAVELLGRDIEAVALGVLDEEVLAFLALGAATHESSVEADSVVDVDDVVARS